MLEMASGLYEKAWKALVRPNRHDYSKEILGTFFSRSFSLKCRIISLFKEKARMFSWQKTKQKSVIFHTKSKTQKGNFWPAHTWFQRV